jgi:predicted aldo/keto reductase-like oxidoreductase
MGTEAIKTISGDEATPIGLAGNPDTQKGFVESAWSSGVNYFFFYNATYQKMIEGIREIADRDRERMIVATGIEVRNPEVMRQYRDRILELLGTDVIDVFFAQYVAPSDNLEDVIGKDGALDEIRSWQEAGLIRYVGATAHSRPLSTKLLDSGKIVMWPEKNGHSTKPLLSLSA